MGTSCRVVSTPGSSINNIYLLFTAHPFVLVHPLPCARDALTDALILAPRTCCCHAAAAPEVEMQQEAENRSRLPPVDNVTGAGMLERLVYGDSSDEESGPDVSMEDNNDDESTGQQPGRVSRW